MAEPAQQPTAAPNVGDTPMQEHEQTHEQTPEAGDETLALPVPPTLPEPLPPTGVPAADMNTLVQQATFTSAIPLRVQTTTVPAARAYQEVIIPVCLVDGSHFPLKIQTGLTGEDMYDLVCDKLCLKEKKAFALYASSSRFEVSRKLKRNDDAINLVQEWVREEDTWRKFPCDEEWQKFNKTEQATNLVDGWKHFLLFQKRLTIAMKDRKLRDPVARQLALLQVRHELLRGRLVCDCETATELAALLFIVYHGPCDKKKTLVTEAHLLQILPFVWLVEKPAKQWVELITKRCIKLGSKVPNRTVARDMFLLACEDLFNYGITFFENCRPRTKKEGVATLGHSVSIGVGVSGLFVCSDYTPQGRLHSFPLKELVDYSCTEDKLAFEVDIDNKKAYFTFECPKGQAGAIVELIDDYLDIRDRSAQLI